ncbi:hypothetical protein [Yersinia aleksiciae]|uniref:hypothetical protein n=1 Tax=Yersinia aleksiciae TaxID=263819 RepID=UPI0011A9F4B6|nr:hypothetical protein [Yersinia aleksiciae]
MKHVYRLMISTVILLTSTTVHSAPVEKIIPVEATIEDVVFITKADGTPLNVINLDHRNFRNGITTFYKEESVNVTTGLNTFYSIKLKNDLILTTETDKSAAWVALDGKLIGTDNSGYKYHSRGLRILSIETYLPNIAGEVYKGTLELVIESQA